MSADTFGQAPIQDVPAPLTDAPVQPDGDPAPVDREAAVRAQMVASLNDGASTVDAALQAEVDNIQRKAAELQKKAAAVEAIRTGLRTQLAAFEELQLPAEVAAAVPGMVEFAKANKLQNNAISHGAREAAVAGLQSADPQVLIWAFGHAWVNWQSHKETFIAAFQNPDPGVRLAALQAVESNYKEGEKAEVAGWLEVFLDEADPAFGVAAVKAFGYIDTDRDGAWVATVLSKANPAAQVELIKEIGLFFADDEKSAALLKTLLGSPYAAVRKTALAKCHLSEDTPPDIYEEYIRLFGDPDPQVRQAAWRGFFYQRGVADNYFYYDKRAEAEKEPHNRTRHLAMRRREALCEQLVPLINAEKDKRFKSELESKRRELQSAIRRQKKQDQYNEAWERYERGEGQRPVRPDYDSDDDEPDTGETAALRGVEGILPDIILPKAGKEAAKETGKTGFILIRSEDGKESRYGTAKEGAEETEEKPAGPERRSVRQFVSDLLGKARRH